MLNRIVLKLLKGEMRRRHSAAVTRAAAKYISAEDWPAYVEWASKAMVPNVTIGGEDHPYMFRWFVIPRNKWFNVYLHHFLRSDDDRALHDHPWWNMSWLLEGSYDEIVFKTKPPSVREGWEYSVPETKRVPRREGQLAFRGAVTAHRVVLLQDGASRCPTHLDPEDGANWYQPEKPVWTLFITGPKIRGWGFWCAKAWRHWENFVEFPKGSAAGGVSRVGRGCGEE